MTLTNKFGEGLTIVCDPSELSDRFIEEVGDRMNGILNMGNNRISNLAEPTDLNDAVSMAYLQKTIAEYFQKKDEPAKDGITFGGSRESPTNITGDSIRESPTSENHNQESKLSLYAWHGKYFSANNWKNIMVNVQLGKLLVSKMLLPRNGKFKIKKNVFIELTDVSSKGFHIKLIGKNYYKIISILIY